MRSRTAHYPSSLRQIQSALQGLSPMRGIRRLAGDFLTWALRLATSARNAACNAIVDLLDAGSAAGTILIRTGTQPTNVGDSDTGTLLGTLTWSDPAFGNASTGVATASAVTSDTNADASGTAGHFRAKDSDANIVADGTCAAGSGDLSFDNATIVAGGTIAISSFTVTVPIS